MAHLFITQDLRLVDSNNKEVDRRAGTRLSDVMVWVPSEEVTLLEVNIPTRNAAELEQSLPYAVEEELLDDIDKLHIVWNITSRNVPLRVAVVRKELMTSWLDLIKPLKLSGFQLVPDVFALPFDASAQTPSLWIEPDRCILRNGLFSGLAGSPEAVEAFIKVNQLTPVRYYRRDSATKLANQSAGENKKTSGKAISGNTTAQKAASSDTTKKTIDAKATTTAATNTPEPPPIPAVDTGYPGLPISQPRREEEYINLLQGDYVAGAAFSRVLKRSYAPLVGVALIALLVLGHQVVQYFVLRKDVAHFSQLVELRAREMVPGYRAGQPLQPLVERKIANRRRELEERPNTTWGVFEQAIPLLRNCNNCVYEAITVDQNNIQMTLSSFSSLGELEGQLKSLKGFQVQTGLSNRRVGKNDFYTLSLTLGPPGKEQQ